MLTSQAFSQMFVPDDQISHRQPSDLREPVLRFRLRPSPTPPPLTDDDPKYARTDRERIEHYPKKRYDSIALAFQLDFDDDDDAAVEVLLHYLDQEPADPDTIAFFDDLLGKYLLFSGKYELAIYEFQEALKEEPNWIWYADLGIAYSDLGNHVRSLGEYRAALDLDRDDGTLHEDIADELVKLGALDEAVDEYKKAIELLNRDTVTSAPEPIKESNSNKEASQEVISISEQSKVSNQDNEAARCQVKLGRVLLQNGNPMEAAIELSGAAGLDADAYFWLNRLFIQQGRQQAASRAYSRFMQTFKSEADAHFEFAILAHDAGDLPTAISESRRAVALGPNDGEFHKLLAEYLAESQDLLGAHDEILKALTNDSSARMFHSAGILLKQWGFLKDAINRLEVAHAMESGNITYRNDLEDAQDGD